MTQRVRSGLYVAFVGIVLLAGIGSWTLGGAALRPVERMRRSAEAISVTDATGRVTVPHTRDELAALGTTFNELLDRLAHALTRQRRLVADAGHELRGPLAILRAELELAARPERTRDELALAVTAASDEAARIATLAEDLLLLARSDDGALQVHRVYVNVAEFLRDVIERHGRHAAERGVSIEASASDNLQAAIDPYRVHHALDNLIVNALRVSGGGDVIEVLAREDEAGLILEVRDQGPGFPAHFLTQAFEPFSRPEHARAEDSGGTGLGLAIVRAVAEAHDGQADAINNVEGPGASVRMYLGRAPESPRATGEGQFI